MTRGKRIPLKTWMFVYVGLAAAIVVAGPPTEVAERDSVLPLPVVVGSAPLFRKDI
ncbi:MAG: hypothetical protein QNJ11_06455 [Woeseiaceae bacterium]|nr:hypothetical protein [Woeseiaceae bacterium]